MSKICKQCRHYFLWKSSLVRGGKCEKVRHLDDGSPVKTVVARSHRFTPYVTTERCGPDGSLWEAREVRLEDLIKAVSDLAIRKITRLNEPVHIFYHKTRHSFKINSVENPPNNGYLLNYQDALIGTIDGDMGLVKELISDTMKEDNPKISRTLSNPCRWVM